MESARADINGTGVATGGQMNNRGIWWKGFQELVFAGMVAGTFSGTGSGTGNEANAGINVPEISIKSAGISLFYDTDTYAGNPAPSKHVFSVGLYIQITKCVAQ